MKRRGETGAISKTQKLENRSSSSGKGILSEYQNSYRKAHPSRYSIIASLKKKKKKELKAKTKQNKKQEYNAAGHLERHTS